MKIDIILLLLFISISSFAQTDTTLEISEIPDSTIEMEMVEDTEMSIELEMEVVEGESQTLDSSAVDSLAENAIPEIEKMPEFIKTVEPDYPKEVYSQGIEGIVLVTMIVNDSGSVDSVWLEKGVHPVLDTNVLKAAKQFLFTPATAGGENVAVMLQYEKEFTLKEVVSKVEKYINFTGRLREKGTRKPLTDAMVVLSFTDPQFDTTLDVPFEYYFEKIGSFEGQYIEEDKLVTLTDSLGRFSFTSLPAGPINVKSPLAGYEVLEEKEIVRTGEQLEVEYLVQKVSYSELEMVVYGKRETKEVTRRKLSINEVKKIPGLGGDAVKVVQALPGVARPTFGISEIVVRGASDADSKFFLDGVEIPLLFHFGGIKSTYNSDLLEAVDFYPGGFGSRYGNVTAGVIEITGRKAKSDRIHGYVDANFYDGSILIEGPINEKLSFAGEIRKSFIGDIIKLAAESSPSATVLTTAPSYWDYLLRTDYEINDKHSAYLTFFGVKDEMEMISSDVRGGSSDISEAKDQFYLKTLFHMGLLGWNAELSDRVSNSFKYSILYGGDEVSAFGFWKSTDDYLMHTVRDQLEMKVSKKIKFNLGADIQIFPLDLEIKTIDGEGKVVVDKTEDWLFGDIAAYANLEWRPNDKVVIIPGIRYDYFPELNYDGAIIPEYKDYENIENEGSFSGEPSFRINGRYEFIDNNTIKGAFGNYSQTPQPFAQAVHPRWGDPSLSVTRASHVVLGYEWQITDLVHLDFEGYYNKQWNVPRVVIDSLTGSGFKDDGKKRMKGLELMLRHDQGERFFGWIAYSLSHSEEWNHNENRWVLFSKDQTHNLIALGSWRLPKNWEVGFKLQCSTGDPETPIIGSVYNENNQSYEVEYGKVNSDRLDPTVQLDLRIDKKIILKRSIVSAYIDFYNIGYFLYKSPQMYIENSDYPWDEVSGEVIRTPVYQYSIFSIGLKVEF